MPYTNEGGFQLFGSVGEPHQDHLRVTSQIPAALQQFETQLSVPGISSNGGGYSTNADFGLFCSPHTAASILSIDRSYSYIDWTNHVFDTTSSASQGQNVHDSDLRWLTQPALGNVPPSVSEDVQGAADCDFVAQIPCEDPASLPEPVPGGSSYTDPLSEAKDLGYLSWEA